MKSYKGNGKDILIVEDSPTQADMLKFLLEKNDFNVSVAYNGNEAFAMISNHKPSVVISDIVMPEMDGFELCRRIKEDKLLNEIPVILLTALSDSIDVVKGLECGADNFLTKPYDEKYLLSRIQYLLANKLVNEEDKTQVGIEIFFGGSKHYITAQRQQILNLLISTYETAIWKNIELQKIQDELRTLNEELEIKVEERTAELKKSEEQIRTLNSELEEKIKKRTAELEEKNTELEHFNKLFVGRELRMIELKDRIKELEKEIENAKIHS